MKLMSVLRVSGRLEIQTDLHIAKVKIYEDSQIYELLIVSVLIAEKIIPEMRTPRRRREVAAAAAVALHET